MSAWGSAKARRVLAALLRLGWRVTRQTGSHRTLEREGSAPYTWSFADHDELGPKMLARIARHTGLTPDDL